MEWIRLGIASCVFFVTTKVTKFVLNDPILPAFHLMRNCLLQSFGCLNTQASQDIWSTRECSYSFSILLMVQKSGKLTSWDGQYPIIYRRSYMFLVVGLGISEPNQQPGLAAFRRPPGRWETFCNTDHRCRCKHTCASRPPQRSSSSTP